MDSIYIVLIEPTDINVGILEKNLSSALKEKIVLQKHDIDSIEYSLSDKHPFYDLVLIGEKNVQSNIIRIGKLLRGKNYGGPILVLTHQSEAQLTLQQKAAGIDDFLDIPEINLPTFSWTLMSLIKKAEIQKKAEEFDTIRQYYIEMSEQLTNITHEINNPLGVIRLALFQIKNKEGSEENKDRYFKMIGDNIDKIEDQIKSLRTVRTKIKSEQKILSKILSKKE